MYLRIFQILTLEEKKKITEIQMSVYQLILETALLMKPTENILLWAIHLQQGLRLNHNLPELQFPHLKSEDLDQMISKIVFFFLR